ncbi:MAG: hypothetical protein HRU17_05045 [Polyangiaceae bacterium]|nr:hypothetical protein [Polyangiaceae bacterium]
MQRIGWGTCLVGVALGLLQACGATVQEAPSGGESHFLDVCEQSCGSQLHCIAGICTQSCLIGDATCNGLAGGAVCTAASVEPGEVAVCDVPCAAESDCAGVGAQTRCVGGFCRNGVATGGVDAAAVATVDSTVCETVYQANLGPREVFFDPCITWDGRCGAIYNGLIDLGASIPEAYRSVNDYGDVIWCVPWEGQPNPVVDYGVEEAVILHPSCPEADYGDFVLPGCCSSEGLCGGGNDPIRSIYPGGEEYAPSQCLTWEHMGALMPDVLPAEYPATLPCDYPDAPELGSSMVLPWDGCGDTEAGVPDIGHTCDGGFAASGFEGIEDGVQGCEIDFAQCNPGERRVVLCEVSGDHAPDDVVDWQCSCLTGADSVCSYGFLYPAPASSELLCGNLAVDLASVCGVIMTN